MTADALFDYVLALMFSGTNEKSEMLNQYLATLNIHLAELLDKENGFREEPLEAPPIITSLSDTVDYNRRILAFLPYGIAGTMLAEDDAGIAVQYKNKYEELKANCIICKFVEVSNEV
jgi:hypothetical protein